MKKTLILVGLVLLVSGLAMAETWSYAWPANVFSKTYDSLIMITTVTDTSVGFWFKKDNNEINVLLDSKAKAATATAFANPLIVYKLVGGDGNNYGADSANGWTKLCDSSHVTISAAAHTYMFKTVSNKRGARGIIFKGQIAPIESTITKIRVVE